MKLKLGIIYGVLIWIITHIFFEITHTFIVGNNPNAKLILVTGTIIVSGFFSILYIREINENEVLEGIFVGIIFILIDIVLDVIFFIIPHHKSILFSNYTSHILLMSIITLIITTFLGYLAQMNIELK